MLKKFEEYIKENFKSDPISIGDKTYYIETAIKDSKLNVYLVYNGDLYEELSVIIPESDSINKDEFFLNPKVRYNIINELESRKFIQKLNKQAKAGDKTTNLYCIV
jgi:hypothetical protein